MKSTLHCKSSPHGLLCSLALVLFSLTACGHRIPHSQAHLPYMTQKVLLNAKSMLGIPYRYGGLSPGTGFDCSGLVYFSHARAGIELPRTAKQQFIYSRPVRRAALRPGDLVFFTVNHTKVSHVGIYLGNNQFIHSPGSGKQVSITNMNNSYWKSRFIRGGRV